MPPTAVGSGEGEKLYAVCYQMFGKEHIRWIPANSVDEAIAEFWAWLHRFLPTITDIIEAVNICN